MAYSKTAWTDRAVQYPSRFTMVTNADGTITLTPSPGTITNAGTPITAANLNNLENQYGQAITDIESWVNSQGFLTTSNFLVSKVSNGYQKLPTGIIIQWGQVQNTGGINGQQIPFPITFPSSLYAVVPIVSDSAAGTNASEVWITGKTTSYFYARSNGNYNINFIAVGI